MKSSSVPIPEPIQILKNPEQHKPLIMNVLQNGITAKLSSDHPYKKYFTLIAKHIGIGSEYNMANMLKSISPDVLNTITENDVDTEESE